MRLREIAIAALLISFSLSTARAAPAPMDIHAAVRAGDVEQVDAALKSGAGLNSPDNWGRTPLIVALQQGKAPVVEMLLSRGASVAATDAWGRTPLLVATQLKNTAAIRLLLEQKSDVNAANRNDITPLISAAQTGNQEAATMLLRAGAAPDRADNLGWTALMWAAFRKDAAIAKLLFDNGADAAKVGRDKSTALEIARSRGADAALIALAGSENLIRILRCGGSERRRAETGGRCGDAELISGPRRQPDYPRQSDSAGNHLRVHRFSVSVLPLRSNYRR